MKTKTREFLWTYEGGHLVVVVVVEVVVVVCVCVYLCVWGEGCSKYSNTAGKKKTQKRTKKPHRIATRK